MILKTLSWVFAALVVTEIALVTLWLTTGHPIYNGASFALSIPTIMAGAALLYEIHVSN